MLDTTLHRSVEFILFLTEVWASVDVDTAGDVKLADLRENMLLSTDTTDRLDSWLF